MRIQEWAKKVEELGAGEILLTSMDKDGTRDGFDIEFLNEVLKVVNIPVIASGGCGDIDSFYEVFKETDCDAALAASIFHYKEATIGEVKEYLHERNIEVRL